jgi:hypothetical protein
MIDTFEDFCTWMDVIVDDLWQQIAPCSVASARRRGAPTASCWPWPSSASAAAGTWRPSCWGTSASIAISSPDSPPRVASTVAAAS